MLLPSERIAAFFRALVERPADLPRAPQKKEEPTAFERAIAVLAALICLFFVATLRDAPLVWQQVAPVAARLGQAPAGDGRVHVHVVGADRSPAPDSVVRVFSIIDGRAYLGGEARTGPTGELDFSKLPRGETWIIAYGQDKARTSTRLILGADPRDVSLTLGPATALEARVVDSEGQPVAAVEVHASSIDPLPSVAVSDADGHVIFDRLGSPPYAVSVDVAGFDPVKKTGVFPAKEPLTLRLEQLGGFEVHVATADGQPAVGATVFLSGPGIWPARSTTTDEDGVATILSLRTGVYDLKARLGSLVSTTDMSVRVSKGVIERRDLVVSDGETVRVRVTDGVTAPGDDPVPVEGAKVSLVEEGISAFPLEAKTDKQGEALIGPVSTKDAMILARADGFVPSSVSRSMEKDGVVVVPLMKGGVIEGDVRDTRGFPIDGATIEVIGTDDLGMPIDETGDISKFSDALFAFALGGAVPLIPRGELGVMPGPIPDIPRLGEPVSPGSTKGGEPWVTALDGTFHAAPVTPGRVHLLVRHPSYIEEVTDVMTLAPGATATVHIVLKEGGRLEGRVLEESRLPVAGARVEIVATEGTFEAITYTADDGTFAVAAVPEEVMITVMRPETPSDVAAQLVVNVPSKEKEKVEIVLPKVRESVVIAVEDDRRQPVARTEVRVTSLDLETALARTVFTDDDGKAEVPNARGLPLRIVLDHPGKAPIAFTVDDAGSEHRFTMHDALTLRGVVTARDGRDKVEGADLTLYTETGPRHATSAENGEFEVGDLAEGRIRIVTVHPGHATGDHVVFFSGDARRPITIAPIDLAAAGDVSGTVVDSQGDAVAGARVAMGGVPTYLPVGKLPADIAQTDKNGRFSLGGLPEGKVSLEAYSPDLGRGEIADVDIRAGRTTDRVEIKIPDQDYQAGKMKSPASVAITLALRDEKLVILSVPMGSEAEYAGLEPEDVLLSVSGHDVHTPEEARDLLSGPIGHDVIVEIERKEISGPVKMKLRVRREVVRR